MDNPRAFPKSSLVMQDGMTLRDYFAAKALQGLVGNGAIPIDKNIVSRVAWEYADAMLKAREK